MEAVYLIIAALAGLFLYERSKRGTAESLLGNLGNLLKVGQQDKDKHKVDGLLEAEEVKRLQLKEDMAEAKTNEEDLDSLSDDFNKRK